MTPEQQVEFDAKVGRGLVAALLYVVENSTRWPALDDIRLILEAIFAEAHPDIAGEFRSDSYWPQYSRFAVPRWQDVPACMLRLEDLIRRAEQECDSLVGADRLECAVEWAATIHHRFECIHPFQDGNGRTGRALVSWVLAHNGLPQFDLPLTRRNDYIAALEHADTALTTQDLLFADRWPHQLEALQPLIDLIGEVVECGEGASSTASS